MRTSTAIGANNNKSDLEIQNIIFISEEHKKFYQSSLNKCKYKDTYHKSLCYCLGISEDTREHVDEIYDFIDDSIKKECINKGWQTSGSCKIVRLAFNLYTDRTPTVFS